MPTYFIPESLYDSTLESLGPANFGRRYKDIRKDLEKRIEDIIKEKSETIVFDDGLEITMIPNEHLPDNLVMMWGNHNAVIMNLDTGKSVSLDDD